VACLAAALGLLARLPVGSVLGDTLPYITFFPAIALSSRYGGVRAGLLTTGLSAVLATFFVLPPIYALHVASGDAIGLALFVATGMMIGWITQERNLAMAHLQSAHERERQARVEAQGALERVAQLYQESERLRRDAEAASRAKDEFLAMLGHELRNPLAPIVTAIELLRLRGHGRLGREEQVIARQVQHVCRMVDDLLDVSRITRGMVTLSKRPMELGTILARALEMASPLLESRRHRVTVDAPRTGLHVDADPDRMAQIFTNLLTNAAKYSDPGGQIGVMAARAGGEIVVRVQDSGVGMKPDLLARIFDPFVQGPQGPERPVGGLGIGLALVKSLVSLHGGRIEARSGGVGQGSEFEVRLPARDSPPPEQVDAPKVPSLEATSSHRVLVVDDNEDAAALLADVLRAQGWTVAVALDGPQALLLLDDFQPDVAVLDIGLPVMDGYELASRILERLGPGAPRLLAVTGYGQDRDRASSQKAGFERHLVKPVSGEELIAAITETKAAHHEEP
jgi:signal transduction histidine kinase/ActR/RegA family two-component response regulator